MDAPRRWKVIVMNFVVVFPVVQFNTRIVSPWLDSLAWPIRDGALVLIMCIALSFALPKVNQRLGPWLRR